MKKLIEFLKSKFPEGIQMFDTRNFVGDRMVTIYEDGKITVDYCYDYEYIEVFGLTEEEFEILNKTIGAD